MIFRKKLTVICALFLCLCLGVYSMLSDSSSPLSVSSKFKCSPTVILDAGHGGFDGGAVAEDGTVEKDINLIISLQLGDMLRSAGYKVILTRQTDTSTDSKEDGPTASRKKSDLKNRLELMKKHPEAIFVSIHLNKFTTSAARGSQVFYSGNHPDSKRLSDHIQTSIVSLLQPENTRVNKLATSSTYLLYNATVPAVLVECGFLSNKAELQLLKDGVYQQKMAFSIFCGINRYFATDIST